jgi:hypothetical protein
MQFGAAMIQALSLSTALILAAAHPASAADLEPTATSEVDAIECRLDGATYRSFAFGIEGEEEIARNRGWKKVRGTNPMLLEFDLPAPITVAKTFSTRRIAFTSDGILAVLDLADPNVLAAREKIPNIMDAEPMIASIVASGKATRAQAEAMIQFRKFLGEEVVQTVTEPPEQEGGYGIRTTIATTISNVTTHAGKTFYGCSYRVEVLDENGEPL